MRIFTTLCTLLIAVITLAQNSNITVYDAGGQSFFVSLNGVRQNAEAYSNVRIAGATTGSYQVKLVFSDGKTGELNKKILLEDAGDYLISVSGRGNARTLKFIAVKPGKTSMPEGGTNVQYRPNDEVPYSDKKSSAVPAAHNVEVGIAVTPAAVESESVFTKTYDPSDTAGTTTHDLAYTYFTTANWPALEELFTADNLNGGWPPNWGFVSMQAVTLEPGTLIDRYGGWISNGQFVDSGAFVSPLGTPFPERALPASAIKKPYSKYVVLKPIPNVQSGQAIPWFGEPGMGVQYQLPECIAVLLSEGYIEKQE